ncbi:BPI fold-containing family A member 3 [Suncus etruscus]|uniref:BPI fold-containing family A member 3 n=1 Tax=Suncus etruscus TaxID=109475 RepID=UPI0021105FA6|nr:BPI fold-containing family A member 3 [Suncus etruscus]
MHLLWRLLVLINVLSLLSTLQKQPWAGLMDTQIDRNSALVRIIAQGLMKHNAEHRIQNLRLLDSVTASGQMTNGMVGWLISSIVLQKQHQGSTNITNIHLDYEGIWISFHEDWFSMNITHEFDIDLNQDFNNKITKMHVSLNLTVEFWLEKDEFGRRDLVIGNCHVDPNSVSITIHNEDYTPKMRFFLHNFKNKLDNVIPHLVGSQMCPLIEEILRQMDVKLLKSLMEQAMAQELNQPCTLQAPSLNPAVH